LFAENTWRLRELVVKQAHHMLNQTFYFIFGLNLLLTAMGKFRKKKAVNRFIVRFYPKDGGSIFVRNAVKHFHGAGTQTKSPKNGLS
jgi:hypothetical protein